MFSAIEGGFRVMIDGLFTWDFSWLMCFASLSFANISIAISKGIKKIRGKKTNE